MTVSTRVLCVAVFCALAPLGRCQDAVKKKAAPKPPSIVAKEIEGCVSKLGAESFRDRRKATKRLLELARFSRPKGEDMETPYEPYVVERMEKLYAHKDPEVAQRAKEVVLKLHPVPKTKLDWSKFVKLPHFVDQDNDTFEIIAEMYGSRVEWIKAANPALKTNADLRKVKELTVPVENLAVK